jgi:hypothetical protein
MSPVLKYPTGRGIEISVATHVSAENIAQKQRDFIDILDLPFVILINPPKKI